MEASARRATPEQGAGPEAGTPAPGSAVAAPGGGQPLATAQRAGVAGASRSAGAGDLGGAATRFAGWRRFWPAVAAVAGGLLLTLAFPPAGWWPLAPAAVALITAAIWQPGAAPARKPLRRGAALGFLAGAAFFLVLVFWLHVIGPDAWLVLAIVEAAYFAPLGAGIAAVARLRLAPLWAACGWMAEEAVRGRAPLGGFTWGRLAFSQSATPFTRYASVGGAPLLTFVIALAGGLITVAVCGWPRSVRTRDARHTTARLAAAAAVIALAVAGPAIPLPRAAGRSVTAAVVQGNVPRLGLHFFGQRSAVLDNHVNAMHKLATLVWQGRLRQPDLVILPENSSDLDPYQNLDAYTLINSAVRAVGVPTLVGTMTFTSDGQHLQNRGIVWSPVSGPGAYYVKQHPVPFGEYVPMRRVLSKFIKRFSLVPYDQVPGHRTGVLHLGPAVVGDVICFEVAYDGLVRDVAGAGLLVVQTNNATFGRTVETWQQLAMGRLRAVEHGRSLVVAATSGVSAIIDPDGHVAERSAVFTTDVLVRAVDVREGTTLATRLGAGPEWLAVVVALAALILAVTPARRGHPRRAGPTDGTRRARERGAGEAGRNEDPAGAGREEEAARAGREHGTTGAGREAETVPGEPRQGRERSP